MTNCPRCGGAMKPGQALEQTWGGEPEWPGDTIYTVSPAGPGRLVDCMKCEKCGHSISDNVVVSGSGAPSDDTKRGDDSASA